MREYSILIAVPDHAPEDIEEWLDVNFAHPYDTVTVEVIEVEEQ